jgi:chemotaxis signal transduction protein
LFLVFQIGSNRYAQDARRVAEVLPLVGIRKIPQAPAGVAGVGNYRGAPVPAVDLSELILGQPAQSCLSTRIVLVHEPNNSDETVHEPFYRRCVQAFEITAVAPHWTPSCKEPGTRAIQGGEARL